MSGHLSRTLFLLLIASTSVLGQSVETGFLNRTLMLNGESYRYQVYVPADYSPARRWPVILFLHGGGGRGSDGLLATEAGIGTALRRYSERYPGLVVFPQGRVGDLWGQLEANVALGALTQTEQEFATDHDRVYLAGMSRGGEAAYYLAYRQPTRFAALLVACGRVQPLDAMSDPVVPAADGEPFGALAARIRNVPVWLFHGEADMTISVEQSRRLRDALKSVSTSFSYTEIPGVGHNSWDAAFSSEVVATWLFKQRRKQ